MHFNELSLIDPLLKAVKEAGYEEPSPIQEMAIPPVLNGRDLLGCAQTGTGKTAAFALPILQLLNDSSTVNPKSRRAQTAARPIRSLILTPTRELALQIQESFELYGKYLPLRSTVIFGGVGQAPQVQQLKRGVDILVATPGRLNDLIGQGYIKLGQLEIFVLDEADRMLDMGFVHDVKKVIAHLPQKRQTLLFSATMPDEIVKLADSLLHNPAKVFVTPASTTVEAIEQSLYLVDKANKRRLLAHLLQDSAVTSALVFTRTKHGADRVVRELKKDNIPAMAIHGNKSQNARQDALARFKDGRVRVLVATDIAARGLDINELSHVINYDLPNIPETYVHRIGRTGRAGRGGIAISFCCGDELEYLADIEKLIGFAVPRVESHPWPMQDAPPPPPAPVSRSKSAKNTGSSASSGQSRAKAAPSPSKAAPAKGNHAPPTKGDVQSNKTAAKTQSTAPKGRPTGKPARRPAGKPMPNNPYENRTGGNAIITKRPVWSQSEEGKASPSPGEPGAAPEGEDTMSRNNNRRRRGKNRGGQSGASAPDSKAGTKQNLPPIPKNEHGIFDFSEEELAQDNSLRIISTTTDETKYASFEDYLKDH